MFPLVSWRLTLFISVLGRSDVAREPILVPVSLVDGSSLEACRSGVQTFTSSSKERTEAPWKPPRDHLRVGLVHSSLPPYAHGLAVRWTGVAPYWHGAAPTSWVVRIL
ncbi:uncharacterized protein B0H18DRAFT_320353 [Fomitopsis serialis]|uniref:uncharacterized protein n=1 Tax=Fomitopsis serialis TaxID=139415 RepID=UPI0020087C9F|nr:uncharacterized protein B0H18DRAFT_320353 [Neoantrodia serialis]KAH9936331.1 hypothetical protein B0H18DRAFT_320353 [Neoantrodia serialis]